MYNLIVNLTDIKNSDRQVLRMVLTYNFEQKKFDYEITPDEIVRFTEILDSADMTRLIYSSMVTLSATKKAKMQKELGAFTRSDVSKLARTQRQKLNEYVVANGELFKTAISHHFRHEAERSFDTYMCRRLMYA